MCCKKEDFLGIEKNKTLRERNIEVLSFSVLDSTQAEARRHAARGGRAPALILADTQTHGRGRLGRNFWSPPSTGIYMTLLFDVTDETPFVTSHITSAVAVAVTRSVESVTNVRCGIKWVNDVYVGGRKACGIIAESFAVGDRRYATVGVGVNLCTRDFPDELSEIAVSLCDGATDGLRRSLTVALAVGICDVLDDVRAGDTSYMDEYRARSTVLGRGVTFTRNGETREGLALGIDDEGGLVVLLPDGQKTTLTGGEITLRVIKETHP